MSCCAEGMPFNERCHYHKKHPQTMVAREIAIGREYQDAAEWVARRGFKGIESDPLPPFLSAECLELINNNIDGFTTEVRLAAYALAQAKRNV